MRITTLPRYGKGKYALKRAIERETGRFAIIGRPGIGKSVLTGRLVYQYLTRKLKWFILEYRNYNLLKQAGAEVDPPRPPLPVIVAVNLRQQVRVWEYAFKSSGVYNTQYAPRWIIIEPKWKKCNRKIIKKGDNLYNILEKCLTCPLRGRCDWNNQFKQSALLYIITHEQLPIIMLSKHFQFDIIVIDEADTLFDAFSHEIPKQKIDALIDKLKQMGLEKEAKEIERRIKYFYDYYDELDIYVPKWMYPKARLILELTATAPYSKALYEYLTGGFEWYITLDEKESEVSAQYEEHDYTKKFRGYILLKENINLDTIVVYDKINYVKNKDEWVPELANLIIYIVKELGKTVGVTLPNYKINEEITEILRDKNIQVFSDAEFRTIGDYNKLWQIYRSYGRKKVELVTIAGRFSRGVSMEEKDIIIGTFQRTINIRLNKKHLDILEKRSDLIKDIPRPALSLRQFFNSAESLQALFRFNRKPGQPHIVILFDKRLIKAFETTTLRYYYNDAQKIEVSTVQELKSVLRSII